MHSSINFTSPVRQNKVALFIQFGWLYMCMQGKAKFLFLFTSEKQIPTLVNFLAFVACPNKMEALWC